MQHKSWDVFICHASEDKTVVALPLAQILHRSGVRVWLDAYELKVGDSLSEKIDHGLLNSHLGIVILSPSFFNNHWTRRELAGLRSIMEERSYSVLLPVWHYVDKSEVRKFSPELSDLIASTTDKGLDVVATELLKVIYSGTNPCVRDISITRRLIEMLGSNPSRARLVEFLRGNRHIIPLHSDRGVLTNAITVGNCYFDAVWIEHHSDRTEFIYFSEVCGDPYVSSANSRLSVSPIILAKLEEMDSARQWLVTDSNMEMVKIEIGERLSRLYRDNASKENYMRKSVKTLFVIYCGRRQLIDKDSHHHDMWAAVKKRFGHPVVYEKGLESVEIEMRSYDYIIERHWNEDYARYIRSRSS